MESCPIGHCSFLWFSLCCSNLFHCEVQEGNHKKDGLINIASSLVIAIAIMFLLNSDLSATGILIAIFSFLAAGFIFLCVAILLKDVYSTKKYTLTAIKRIKTENSIDLKDMPEFKSGIFCYKNHGMPSIHPL